ncbi:MAG TPA: MFS transporter [Ilumatobacteraceae bacterium]|nr:MFS transporter [Ilumatobacteraceae bacterium]
MTGAQPATRPATTPLTSRQRLLAVGLILAGSLVAFEVTAILTALPTITEELNGDSLYGLSLAAYTLANMAALVVSGELADRKGPAVPFIVSIVVFASGLVVAAAAGAMIWVVIGRMLQGAGTGGFTPIAYTLVKRAFPEDRQPMMFAFLSAAWVLPSLLAPAISGIVTDAFGWRWVFLGLVPAAVAVGVLAVRPMLEFGPSVTEPRASRIPAALAAAAGVGLFVTGLQFADPIAFGVSIVVGIAIAIPSLRRLLPRGVAFAALGLPAVIAARVLATATFLGVDSFIPLAADRVHGASPVVQGFVIIGAALSWTLGQWIRARSPYINPARAVRQGFVLLFVGIGLALPVLWEGWPLWATFVGWSVGGLGMGLLFNPTSVTSMSYATEGREGLVGSQVALADALGFSLMGGIGGAMVAVADRGAWSITSAIATIFAIAAGLSVLGTVASRNIRPAR